MHILPSEIPQLLENFRPLMRAEVFGTLSTGVHLGLLYYCHRLVSFRRRSLN